MINFSDLKEEEKYLFEAIISARRVQEFLWGENNKKWGIEEWRRMFKKRIVKIDEIKPDNPHAMIELKKRLLQNAALCIALLHNIDVSKDLNKECEIPSNLPEYSE